MFLLDLVSAMFLCFFLLLFGVWCYVKWTHRYLIRAASNLHSLFPTLPILGSLHYARFGNEKVTGLVIEAARKLSCRGIYTTCVWIGPYPIIIVFGLEDIQKINGSIKTPEKGFEVDSTKFAMGNGLFNAPAHIWKVTRRSIEPLFHPRNIKLLIPTLNRNSRDMVCRISQYEGQGTFNVYQSVLVTALQTVCHLVFGSELEFDTNSKGFLSLLKLITTIPEVAVHKILRFWLQSDFIFNYLHKEEIDQLNLLWKTFSTTPLKVARQKIESTNLEKRIDTDNSDDQFETTNEDPINLIRVYTEMQQSFPEFTEEDLKYEIQTMYLAGTDTVTNGVSHCLLLLAYHQEVQNKLYEEITSLIDADSDVTYDDLKRMQYLDQVFKETLRWSMIIPFVSRRTQEDIKLSSCTIPKGSSFLVGNVGPFLDPKIYPDPARFNPDNFLPDNSKDRPKSAFLPFNAGPRYCIGKQYTEIFSRIMIVHIIRKFKLSTAMDVYKLKRGMTFFTYSSEGYNITIQRRSN